MNDDVAGRIMSAARRQFEPARQRLRGYSLHESPTGDTAALNGFLSTLEGSYATVGGRSHRVTSDVGDHLVVEWGHGDRPLCLVGHHDTVWPVGTLAGMPYVDDGSVIRGPGVFDIKGGLVVVEMAFRVLDELGLLASAYPVRLIVVSDEEIGSPDGRRVVLDETCGAYGVLGLEPAHPDGALKTARMGSTRVRLRVTGREAHAALDPEAGVSAVDELVDQLLRLRELLAEDRTTLCNVGRIEGGARTNVVPGLAFADVGLRFADASSERTVLDALSQSRPVRTGAEVVAEVLSSRPTWVEPSDNPLLAEIAAVGARLGQEITGRPASGAGDTNFVGAAGIPALDGLGPLGQGAHAAHEHIQAESLVDRAALLALTMVSL